MQIKGDLNRCFDFESRTSRDMFTDKGPALCVKLFFLAEDMEKRKFVENLNLIFHVVDERSEFEIRRFFFDDPDGETNRAAHARNFLLAFVKVLESTYECTGWPAPPILSWYRHATSDRFPQACPNCLAEVNADNAVMQPYVADVLREQDDGGEKLYTRLVASTF